MKFSTFLCMVLTLIVIKSEQSEQESLNVETMLTKKLRINLDSPKWMLSSSGILKSHSGSIYPRNLNKTLIISAPYGYDLLVAFRLIDLRPRNQDTLTLSIDGMRGKTSVFTNGLSFRNRYYYPEESVKTYFVPNGQLRVTFQTSNYLEYLECGGFQLTYTVTANLSRCDNFDHFYCDNSRCINKMLTCDGHNHCGDRSEQMNCYHRTSLFGPGKIIAIVCGVIIAVAVISVISSLIQRSRARTRAEQEVVTVHPPNNLPSYPQPGTYYPPPPPPYTQYEQGIVNPAYH